MTRCLKCLEPCRRQVMYTLQSIMRSCSLFYLKSLLVTMFPELVNVGICDDEKGLQLRGKPELSTSRKSPSEPLSINDLCGPELGNGGSIPSSRIFFRSPRKVSQLPWPWRVYCVVVCWARGRHVYKPIRLISGTFQVLNRLLSLHLSPLHF